MVAVIDVSLTTVKQPFDPVPTTGHAATTEFVDMLVVLKKPIAVAPVKPAPPIVSALPPSLVSVCMESELMVGAEACATLMTAPDRTTAKALPNKTERDLNLIGGNLS